MQKQKTPTRGSPEVKKLKGYLGMDGQVYNSFEEYSIVNPFEEDIFTTSGYKPLNTWDPNNNWLKY